jgi:hypothetical protein
MCSLKAVDSGQWKVLEVHQDAIAIGSKSSAQQKSAARGVNMVDSEEEWVTGNALLHDKSWHHTTTQLPNPKFPNPFLEYKFYFNFNN